MRMAVFPPGATAYEPRKGRAVSLWRLFNFGMLALTLDIAGKTPCSDYLQRRVLDRLLDSKRNRPRAHIPFGFVPANLST